MRSHLWGRANYRVCWLVGPSTFDVDHMPADYTLMYELREPYGYLGRPGRIIARSIDREEIAEYSRALYRTRTTHDLVTYWYDSEGNRVNKVRYVTAARLIERAAQASPTS